MARIYVSKMHGLSLCLAFGLLYGGVLVASPVKRTVMVPLPAYSAHVHPLKNKKSQKKAKQIEFKKLINRICLQHTKKEIAIPQKTHKSIIRVATYNVHCWRGPEKGLSDRIGGSFSAIFDTIKQTQADILVLQEVELRSSQTYKVFASLGYKYSAFVGGPNAHSTFGNMILSKLPFAQSPIKKNFSYGGSHKRAFVKVEIDLSTYGKKNLVIYGTHFDDQDRRLRILEAQELISNAQHYDHGKNVIIAADFNEQGGAAIKLLASQGFINNFDLAGIGQPKFTHWSNTVIDGLYAQRKNWNLWIDGAYILYSGASDHVPVIMDIDPKK